MQDIANFFPPMQIYHMMLKPYLLYLAMNHEMNKPSLNCCLSSSLKDWYEEWCLHPFGPEACSWSTVHASHLQLATKSWNLQMRVPLYRLFPQ